MRAILKSESPESCALIANGKKTILLSKTRPKLESPFKGYIYKSFGNKKDSFAREIQSYFNCGKVIGEYVCDRVYQYTTTDIKEGCTITDEEMIKSSCLSFDELFKYENGGGSDSQFSYFGLYGLHISDLKIYDKPKELGEFFCGKKYNTLQDFIAHHRDHLTRPPASWCYVDEQ